MTGITDSPIGVSEYSTLGGDTGNTSLLTSPSCSRALAVWVNISYQFKHYEDYEIEMFSEEDKCKYRDVHFPDDLKKARYAGIDAAAKI